MLLTSSAADSTAMQHKFPSFDYNTPTITNLTPNSISPQNDSSYASRNIEVNLGEVSSTTDILPSPPSKSEAQSFLRCSVAGFATSPPIIKTDPELIKFNQAPSHPVIPNTSQVYSPSVVHSPAFFSPMQQFYQQTSPQYQYSTRYPPEAMYMPNAGNNPAFTGTALSSLINQGVQNSGYSQSSHFHGLGAVMSSLPSDEHRNEMSAELAAAGAVAAAAARARVVGSQHAAEEEVINQQRASRRQMHKICEQKRRDGLKTALETLKMTIPGCSILSDQSHSQQNILLKAYQFVCELLRKQQSNKVVIEELQNIKDKNNMMQAEIDYFKEEYKKLSTMTGSSQCSSSTHPITKSEHPLITS